MILKSIYAFIATLGFAILFNIKGKKLFFASLGGAMSFFFYLLFLQLNFSELSALFFSTIIFSVYSEILARCLKTPVTTFTICALIPLVPGGAMYYTMLESIQGNIGKSLEIGFNTICKAGALAIGIIIVSSTSRFINENRKRSEIS
ncbi:threonine/serine exporter family protein [Clostridium sp. MSJ-4]|uniref:Threonine/serine exporter family protein n=1 Tax=Clostridium simiarum TaxID=2841506 RepID=A0ABS6F007_9CLOT|nr:threonine/serine exporter family protein [Clostridium simiarum]MBU5590963.1 threonine/serine exporter family protein [Clostridium simiarum]